MMMSGRTYTSSSNSSNSYPFTPSQWQELEHQALIYKYMVSGIPIPSDLILPLRRSFFLDSTSMTSPSLAFPPQPSMSWGCFQLGYGRKAEDPEPGRCRRTDGKKWRCSKEAYPDSKYCERHMHRGKSRSRKPVEMHLPSTQNNTLSLPLSISTPHNHFINTSKTNLNNANSYFHLHTTPFSSAQRDHNRYYDEMKDVNGYSLWSESERGELRPLSLSNVNRDGSEDKDEHCFVLGADFKLDRAVKNNEDQKPLRHFFDEWPQKSKDSWLDSNAVDSYSKTQLSISIPMPHHDFPIVSSRYNTD